MSFQTQVVDEATLEAEIQNQATVAKFKRELAELRAFKFECYRRLVDLHSTLKSMSEERASLLSMFDSEAMAMYPELTPDSIGPTLEAVDPAHPLYALWLKYAEKLEALDLNAQQKLESLSVNEADYIQADEREVEILESYAQFAAEASTFVPSVEELSMMLENEEAIPRVDESSLIADISAINELSPEAADMITLEKVEQQEALAAMETQEAIDDYNRNLEPQFNPLGMILAGAALLYALTA